MKAPNALNQKNKNNAKKASTKSQYGKNRW